MQKRTKIIIGVAVVLPLLLVGAMLGGGILPIAFAMHSPVAMTDGVAIGGKDVVSFHAGTAPVKGDAAHSATYRGATWHFATAENKATFEANPAKYAPKCGGYCGFAAGKGFAVATDQSAYAIHEGGLYFFADADVKKTILADPTPLAADCAALN